MELTLITVFLGIIAVAEIYCAATSRVNKHLSEQLRLVEKNCTLHAENAVTMHTQLVEMEKRHKMQVDAMTAKIIELTDALEKAKKQE